MASISLSPYQHTISQVVTCSGVGLHSGNEINLRIKPAPTNSGIRFFRTDLEDSDGIPAHMDKVIDTFMATTIGDKQGSVSTTEHLMAALQGFGIDNADIELDGAEVPIMDGSAGPFMLLLQKAGLRKQKAMRHVLRITREISFTSGDTEIKILPYDGFKISGEIHFEDSLINRQSYSIDVTPERFQKEISRARTFGYVEQVEELWSRGLAQGGNLNNVIAIHWDRQNVLNDGDLRFSDEFVRHKVLDLIGDLALMGCPILGHVIAKRSGHTQHLAFMKTLIDAEQSWEVVEMQKEGNHSAIHRIGSTTKTMGQHFLPFFVPQPCQPARVRIQTT